MNRTAGDFERAVSSKLLQRTDWSAFSFSEAAAGTGSGDGEDMVPRLAGDVAPSKDAGSTWDRLGVRCLPEGGVFSYCQIYPKSFPNRAGLMRILIVSVPYHNLR